MTELKGGGTLEITVKDIVDAAKRLENVAIRTPLLESPWLNQAAGGRVFIKPECLQLTGSFKIRGAYNRLSCLRKAERKAGIVAFSSGNHAQGVAEAARRLGIRACIVMPSDAPRLKRDNTRALGAEIMSYDRLSESREEIAARIAEETGAVLVPSYDDLHIIAGQGTVGLEIATQVKEAGSALDAAFIPVGGGGLVAGSATALKDAFPAMRIHGVEPVGFDDTARSLRLGRWVENRPDARSICDALLAPTPGRLTFQQNMRLLDDGLVVSDEEVIATMRFAYDRLKLAVEPGGAVALAALLSGRFPVNGRTVAIVLSGGNIDAGQFVSLLGQSESGGRAGRT